jgi:hypothetical protein
MPGWHVDRSGEVLAGAHGFAWRAPFQVVVERRPAGVRRVEVLACGHRLSVERSTAETARRRCTGCQKGVAPPTS